jgi:hypothetical protein
MFRRWRDASLRRCLEVELASRRRWLDQKLKDFGDECSAGRCAMARRHELDSLRAWLLGDVAPQVPKKESASFPPPLFPEGGSK